MNIRAKLGINVQMYLNKKIEIIFRRSSRSSLKKEIQELEPLRKNQEPNKTNCDPDPNKKS